MADRPAESYADYRFFRAVAAASSKLTIAGLFFITWTLAFATGHRMQTGTFLGSATVLLLAVSLVSAMISYTLYKRRGGVIEKGPRSLAEASETPGDGQGGQDVPRHEHEHAHEPGVAEHTRPQDL